MKDPKKDSSKQNSEEFKDHDNLEYDSTDDEDDEIIEVVYEDKRKQTGNNDCFKCQNCNFTAQYESLLQQHMKESHINTKPQKCTKCNYLGRSLGS